MTSSRTTDRALKCALVLFAADSSRSAPRPGGGEYTQTDDGVLQIVNCKKKYETRKAAVLTGGRTLYSEPDRLGMNFPNEFPIQRLAQNLC